MYCELHIERNGISSLQDGGRMHQQHLGIPLGGAADAWSMQCANWLVGNDPDSPVIEITLMSPSVRFTAACFIAICGADLSFSINGIYVEMYTLIQVKSGDLLQSGKPQKGCRTYIAIAGKWDVITWQGSVCPLPNGENLTSRFSLKGDQLKLIPNLAVLPKRLPEWAMLQIADIPTIRYIAGPDYAFNEASIELSVSPQSNRMGLRCEVRNIAMPTLPEMISSPVLPGTIQLTPSNQLIILGVDAQTTGGYPRIGQVIQADLHLLGQLAPNDSFSLQKVEREEAIEVLRTSRERLGKLWNLSH